MSAEALEYSVLRERACNPRSDCLQPSVEQMAQWVTCIRRRSLTLSRSPMELQEPGEGSFRELEVRYDLKDVWGHNTTPAMQTLECIQKVKQALVEGPTEDSISTVTFSVLVGVSVVAAMAIIIVWELYVRPRNHVLSV